MGPAFGPAQIRELTEIFVDKSIEVRRWTYLLACTHAHRLWQLRDKWTAEIAKTGQTTRIDVLSWLSKATLDIIWLAGELPPRS